MQRHNILILILVTLIVTAFPVLYQARAYERDVSRRVYQVRLLTIQPTATAGPALQPVFKSKPWEMKKGEGLDVTDFVARSEVEGVVVSESIAVTAPSPLSVEVLTKTEAPAESVQEKSDVNFEKTLVYEIRRLTNHIRKRNDLNLFEDSGPLTRIALGHSADMLAGDYFAHTTPDGCTLTCRFETAVYTDRKSVV